MLYDALWKNEWSNFSKLFYLHKMHTTRTEGETAEKLNWEPSTKFMWTGSEFASDWRDRCSFRLNLGKVKMHCYHHRPEVVVEQQPRQRRACKRTAINETTQRYAYATTFYMKK